MFTTKAPEEAKSKAKKDPNHPESCCTPTMQQTVPSTQSAQSIQSTSRQPSHSNKTMLYVRYNAGFPNTLFIRGQGANLSWSKGIPLKNIQPDLWLFETDIPFSQAEFKILINDQNYEEGSNRTIRSGSQMEFSPRFKR